MLMVKMLRNNEVCVIDDGISYIFDMGGRLKKEDAGLTGYADGAIELPAISLLSSGDYIEVCAFKRGQAPIKYKSNVDAMTCALKVQMIGGFLRMLRRDGTSDGIRFNQLIFIYREDMNLDEILSKLDISREV